MTDNEDFLMIWSPQTQDLSRAGSLERAVRIARTKSRAHPENRYYILMPVTLICDGARACRELPEIM